MLRRLIGEDIHLISTLDPGLKPMKIDLGQIHQIIMDLAINARDAMPEGGILTIETARVILDKVFCETHLGARPGRYIHLRVGDSGIAMDDEVKAHIFDSAQPMNSRRCSERFL